MKTSISSRIYSCFVVFFRLPFLWLFCIVFRRKVKLKFFKTDTYYAFAGIPIRVRWYVRNAWSVHISGIGYVTGHRAHRILSVLPGNTTFTLTASGIGGPVSADIAIKGAVLHPARPSAGILPLKTHADLSRVLDVKLHVPDSSGLLLPATGLFDQSGNERNPLLLQLEQVRMAEEKTELKKIS